MARTILVVDDEPTLRETLVDALEGEGFRVVAAADGRDALTAFRAERPDLVLLDLMLPELSGIEVCRIIRAESGVPIVMLTAKDSELDKVVGLELGADDAGETRTVDVHVHWLRSTLEDDASAPQYIHTVRGVGYVFRRPSEAGT